MPPVEFEATTPASERSQTLALYHSATGIGAPCNTGLKPSFLHAVTLLPCNSQLVPPKRRHICRASHRSRSSRQQLKCHSAARCRVHVNQQQIPSCLRTDACTGKIMLYLFLIMQHVVTTCGKVMVSSTLSQPTLGGGERSGSRPPSFTFDDGGPGTFWIEVLVEGRAVLNAVVNRYIDHYSWWESNLCHPPVSHSPKWLSYPAHAHRHTKVQVVWAKNVLGKTYKV